MKCLIMEVIGNECIALTADGQFVRIRNKGYAVGHEVIHRSTTRSFPVLRLVAATLAIMVALTTATFAYYTPVATVELDLQPAVTFEVNVFDIIISAKATNEEGEPLAQMLDGQFLAIEDGVALVCETTQNAGLLDSPDAQVMVAISANDEKTSQKIETKVKNSITPKVSKSDKPVSVPIVVENVTKQELDECAMLGVSTSKKRMIERVIESNPEMTFDDLKVMPSEYISTLAKGNNDNSKGKTSEGSEPTVADIAPVQPSSSPVAAANKSSEDSKPAAEVSRPVVRVSATPTPQKTADAPAVASSPSAKPRSTPVVRPTQAPQTTAPEQQRPTQNIPPLVAPQQSPGAIYKQSEKEKEERWKARQRGELVWMDIEQ